jgi:hypothetical protein
MEEVAELDVWDVAGRLARALGTADVEGLHALCDAEFWDRAGAEELSSLARDAAGVTLLGALGRRSLLQVETPAAEVARYVVEQQWTERAGALLVEDERLFTLVDRTEVEAAGDADRLARLATKLAAQDVAAAYVAALTSGDAAGFWSHRFDAAHGAEVRPRLAAVTAAELIGSVGPRTLVRVWYADGDETVELLWRPHGDTWLIEGARTFRRPRPA